MKKVVLVEDQVFRSFPLRELNPNDISHWDSTRCLCSNTNSLEFLGSLGVNKNSKMGTKFSFI